MTIELIVSQAQVNAFYTMVAIAAVLLFGYWLMGRR